MTSEPASPVTDQMKTIHIVIPPAQYSPRITAALLLLLFTVNFLGASDPLKRAVNADTLRECRELLAEAGDGDDAVSRTIRGILYHNMSHLGDADAGERAEAELEGIASAAALGYLGSLKTIEGRSLKDAGKLLKARKVVLEGLDLIDRAVERFPDDVYLRLLRVENGLAVSAESPIKRYKVIEKDLDYLMDHPGLQDAEDRSKLLCLAGMMYQGTRKKAEAEEHFARAFEAAPRSRWGRKAQDHLQEL